MHIADAADLPTQYCGQGSLDMKTTVLAELHRKYKGNYRTIKTTDMKLMKIHKLIVVSF